MSMARVFAVVMCLSGLSAAPVRAQQPPVQPRPARPAAPAKPGPTAGLEAGLNLSRVSPDAAGQTITRGPGVLAGAYVHVQMFTTIGLQLELVYTQKHSQLSSDTDLKLDYLELPILAKLKLVKAIYMLEGVAVSFPLRARLSSSAADTDIKNQITTPDLGIVMGGGLPVSKKVAVEIRYVGGFKTVNTSPTAAIQRNRALSAMVRVKL